MTSQAQSSRYLSLPNTHVKYIQAESQAKHKHKQLSISSSLHVMFSVQQKIHFNIFTLLNVDNSAVLLRDYFKNVLFSKVDGIRLCTLLGVLQSF